MLWFSEDIRYEDALAMVDDEAAHGYCFLTFARWAKNEPHKKLLAIKDISQSSIKLKCSAPYWFTNKIYY